jgi:hypothetical protein
MIYCEDYTILDTAYLNPMMVTEALVMNKPEVAENYIINFFLEQQNKLYIFLPYTFKYIFNYTIDRYYFSLYKGFGPKWLQLMKMVMSSRTTSILLNGIPGKVFHCRRGVRQGDPLSPIVFVLAAFLLQSIINSTLNRCILTFSIPDMGGTEFPIVQYVDDTLLFV